jgi:hypothetical protein
LTLNQPLSGRLCSGRELGVNRNRAGGHDDEATLFTQNVNLEK